MNGSAMCANLSVVQHIRIDNNISNIIIDNYPSYVDIAFGPCLDEITGKWRIRKNKKLKQLYQMPDLIGEIKKRRLEWVGQAWRKEGTLMQMVQCDILKEKRPLGRLWLR